MTTIRSQAVVNRLLSGGTPYPPSLPNQESIDTQLKSTNIEVPLALYIEYLQQEIAKEMKRNHKCYNKDTPISIALVPISIEVFNKIFERIMPTHPDVSVLRTTDKNIALFVDPPALSYLFGVGWWLKDTVIDDSGALNGTYGCESQIRINYNKTKRKLLLRFYCLNRNTFGVAQ